MDKIKTFSLVFLIIGMLSCSTSKKTTATALFNTTWELEYLSGPKIAFEGLYPDRKPKITFDPTTKRVEGNNSCNGYSAAYTIEGNEISFGEPGPTTMMYCGEGETFFLNTIKKVNTYRIDAEGKLNLMIDDIIMMRFKKIAKE
ncbi:META domain-containing protein [Maribacter sp. X9]|uniref:META domain-containing protein n=1 Tax=Maribacter sp. X9 TaxID=3402159 RepID=UPI003AF3E08F